MHGRGHVAILLACVGTVAGSQLELVQFAPLS